MTSLLAEFASPKRVIIRAHSDLFAVHNEIINAWFFERGYCQKDETYLWTKGGHYMRVGPEIQNRFHLIIDINKDVVENPDMRDVQYEIWKVVKNPDELR